MITVKHLMARRDRPSDRGRAPGAHDQQLVLYYAASVFMSFLVGLLTMDRLARRNADKNRPL